jgi:hypothetical protein
LTEEEYQARLAKETKPAPKTGHQRWQALGRLPVGTLNKTETEYAALLEQKKQAGEIFDYKPHAMRVRLADNTFYEVDFLVVSADMGLEIHEVKGGFTSDKGQLKIKLCAETLPWFRMVKAEKLSKKQGGGWKLTDFSA